MATYEPKSSKDINFVKRIRERAHYDYETVNQILDAGLLAHVGFVVPQKKPSSDANDNSEIPYPNVIPMVFGRINQTLYLHGYISGRLLKALSGPPTGSVGEEPAPKACVTVSIMDGLIVTTSAMNISNNYRSVCCYGKARLVEDGDEKVKGLAAIVDKHFLGGKKWDDCREIQDREIKSTRVVAIDIETASAVKRDVGPNDDKEDRINPEIVDNIWSGVIPIRTTFGKPISSEYNNAKIPDYIATLENKSI
ncbi:hypothetical protein AYI69_g2144 [Smittium culicis]|uniref:Flavin-nucleotide-binding protein n=1 Tax=Smittium culicis TaxID=133412 RepID=A0A1R1YNC9_9FUNG|nr:hypothetical protein AYI69_g2144 [Smittium culicis]